jgi:hypothetical protein
MARALRRGGGCSGPGFSLPQLIQGRHAIGLIDRCQPLNSRLFNPCQPAASAAAMVRARQTRGLIPHREGQHRGPTTTAAGAISSPLLGS